MINELQPAVVGSCRRQLYGSTLYWSFAHTVTRYIWLTSRYKEQRAPQVHRRLAPASLTSNARASTLVWHPQIIKVEWRPHTVDAYTERTNNFLLIAIWTFVNARRNNVTPQKLWLAFILWFFTNFDQSPDMQVYVSDRQRYARCVQSPATRRPLTILSP